MKELRQENEGVDARKVAYVAITACSILGISLLVVAFLFPVLATEPAARSGSAFPLESKPFSSGGSRLAESHPSMAMGGGEP